MTPEQKQRAEFAISNWNNGPKADKQTFGDHMADLLKRLIDAPEQAAGVPDGWKLAPFEVTDEMVKAGIATPVSNTGNDDVDRPDDYRAVFKSMLAAAPQAPAVQETWPIELCEKTLSTLTYIRGIAERGEGRPMRDDETLEQFLLGYVKRLEAPAVQPDQSEHHLEMVKDAERYRWLRDNRSKYGNGSRLLQCIDSGWLEPNPSFDSAIDAAIEAQKNTPK